MLSGGGMGIKSVRVHRVRSARGGKASSSNTPLSPLPPPQVILTCSSLAAKLLNWRDKSKTGRGVRISSELTILQIRQKKSEVKVEGKNAFFLGH
jgi:hypothetical protein